MSTMLVIPDEIEHRGTLHHQSWMRDHPRDVPVFWWRTRLFHNDVRSLCVAQLQIENLPGWNRHYAKDIDVPEPMKPWSMRIDFNDRRDDWFFPYDYWFKIEEDSQDYDDRTIMTARRTWLDVYMPYPPGCKSLNDWYLGRTRYHRPGWEFVQGQELHTDPNWDYEPHPERYESSRDKWGKHRDMRFQRFP